MAQPGVIMIRVEKIKKPNKKNTPWKIGDWDCYELVVRIDRKKDCKILRKNIHKICKAYPVKIETGEKIIAL